MIKLNRKEDCCGCQSCVQICPQNCIKFIPDEQGFNYPKVNSGLCVNCGACEAACPIINADTTSIYSDTTQTLAYYNKDVEKRKNSSSGGFFSTIAEYVIRNNGVVFGAKFDGDYRVVHSYTEIIEGLEAFRRSKYVQSFIGESYKQVRSFLKDGRMVLFTGTPCQIAGLKQFLKRNYDNLICLDIVCHGVPSPAIWDKYLNEKKAALAIENNVDSPEKIEITRISFRDKIRSWRKYSLSISYKIQGKEGPAAEEKISSEYIWENEYMLCFLKDFINRPSCFECKFRNGRSHSDITMADFWDVEKVLSEYEYICDKGTSMILVLSEKGNDILNQLKIDTKNAPFKLAKLGNPALYRSCDKPTFHDAFLMALRKGNIQSVFLKYEQWEKKVAYVNMYLKKIKLKAIRIWQKLV